RPGAVAGPRRARLSLGRGPRSSCQTGADSLITRGLPMETAAPTSASPVSRHEHEPAEVRVRQLAAARRRATALLAGGTALFVAGTAAGAHGPLLGSVQAGPG